MTLNLIDEVVNRSGRGQNCNVNVRHASESIVSSIRVNRASTAAVIQSIDLLDRVSGLFSVCTANLIDAVVTLSRQGQTCNVRV